MRMPFDFNDLVLAPVYPLRSLNLMSQKLVRRMVFSRTFMGRRDPKKWGILGR
jgi:hypothetical protein